MLRMIVDAAVRFALACGGIEKARGRANVAEYYTFLYSDMLYCRLRTNSIAVTRRQA